MSFLPKDQLNELMHFAAVADKEARSDLERGYIKDENDYTSNFTGALRRIINSNSRTGLSANSFVLSHRVERQMGADAAIILERDGESKVAVFEAKWPRFSNPYNDWDYAQTATGYSHYSDQLERQKRWNDRFAVFEMFYAEYPFETKESYLMPQGSSCVWHRDAEAFRQGRAKPDAMWSQDELKRLLTRDKLGISEVVYAFGICNEGKPLPMTGAEMIADEFQLPAQVLAITAKSESSQ